MSLLENFRTGRPTILTDELKEKALHYIYCDGEEAEWKKRGGAIPTIEDFAHFLEISRDTLYDWEKKDKDFSYILEALRQDQASMLISNGLQNKFNPTISKLLLSSKHNYIEKSEQDITSKGESIGAAPDQALRDDFAEFLKNKK